MKISVEISYYPLHEEYVNPILAFIEQLKTYQDLEVVSNGMSTQVFGEYSSVMLALNQEIEKAFALPRSVFILKIINSDLRIYPNTNE